MNYTTLIYLWKQRSVYLGRPEAPLKMRQGAANFVVSLDRPILYRSNNNEPYYETYCALTPAGVDYQVDTQGALVANCMLDPYGLDFHHLKTHFLIEHTALNGALLRSINIKDFQHSLKRLYENSPNYEEAFKILEEAITTNTITGLSKQQAIPYAVDKRIISVIEELQERVDENLSIQDLAKKVNLSASRLTELFRQQTGIPIRRYRCWHRLFVVSVMMAKTGSLTKASHAAGFTDASHFTKTFHSMVGMCPSKLLSQPDKVRIIIE